MHQLQPLATPESPQESKLLRWVMVFFAALLLLTASGRLASVDAGLQLQSSMVWATTGNLGAVVPPGNEYHAAFVRGINGRYYECHDLGNILLMLPPAIIGAVVTPQQAKDPALPPLMTRVLVSFADALMSSIACLFVFRLLRLLARPRTALLLTCLFVAGTPFWSYTKTAEDVLGATCAVCALLYTSARVLRGESVRSHLMWSSVLVVLAGMFRFSILPFLALMLLLVAVFARKQLRWADVVWGTGAFLVALTPTLWFNWIRTGSIFMPAILLPMYNHADSNLTPINPLHGLWGLFLSPNKGICVFSPVLLLIFVTPFVWKRIPAAFRSLLIACLCGLVPYVFTVARLAGWGGGYGWGPRYMLPVLPMLYLAAVCVLLVVWPRHRWQFATLIALSLLITLPTPLVNVHLVQSEDLRAIDFNANRPWEIMGGWQALGKGLTGQQLSASSDELADPVRRLGAGFPDVWTAYLIRGSRKTAPVGLAATLLLLAVCVVSYRKTMQLDPIT